MILVIISFPACCLSLHRKSPEKPAGPFFNVYWKIVSLSFPFGAESLNHCFPNRVPKLTWAYSFEADDKNVSASKRTAPVPSTPTITNTQSQGSSKKDAIPRYAPSKVGLFLPKLSASCFQCLLYRCQEGDFWAALNNLGQRLCSNY